MTMISTISCLCLTGSPFGAALDMLLLFAAAAALGLYALRKNRHGGRYA